MRYLDTRAVAIDALQPYPGNARRHDDAALDESAEANGQYRSVVARQLPDGALEVLAGHGTWGAFTRKGDTTIRVEVIDADDTEARRIVLADNGSSRRAGYDDAALLALLDAASQDGGLTGTGWDAQAFTDLLDVNNGDGKGPAEGFLPDEDPEDRYREQHGVIVICEDEGDQERTFEELKLRGFNCRLVTT